MNYEVISTDCHINEPPNLYAELSYKQPHIIEAAIATLGPDRCVFGSDAPFNDLRLELEKFAAAVMDDRARELVGAGTLLSLLPEAAG